MDSDDLNSMTILAKSVARKMHRARRRPVVITYRRRPVQSVAWPLYVTHLILN